MVDSGSGSLTLVVETAEGHYLRRVPDATPLLAGVDRGPAAEEATRSAVAHWGLPDLVYRPVVRRVGSGGRELGDAILLVGRRAVVIQVKSRQVDSGDATREAAWMGKAVAKALRQAQGTIRALRETPHALVNLRGREVTIDGAGLDWLAVVVIDHPDEPRGVILGDLPDDVPIVVLLRRDWEFLFDQLRSTHAVVQYLFRVTAEDPVPLGDEPVRYYELAQADAEAPPGELTQALKSMGRVVSVPILPLQPAGRDEDRAHLLLRVVMEDIANCPIGSAPEAVRVQVLAEIDSLAVSQRADLGRHLLASLRDVRHAREGHSAWRLRSVRPTSTGTPHLIFAVCGHFDERVRYAFHGFVQVRHYDVAEALGDLDGLTTIAVLLTPRRDGLRPWNTTMVRAQGDLGLDGAELAELRRLLAPAA